MKVMKKAIAIVLSAAMITGASVSAFAANSEKEGYNFFEHAVDNVFGAVQDGIFAALTALNLRFGVQSAKSYKAGESEFFYPGTNGKVSGSS